MSQGNRTYADQSYGAHRVITFGGLSGATMTNATNGVFSVHQMMFPCKVVAANIKVMGNGIAAGITDLTQVTELQLFRSTDTGTGLETVMGTADLLGATGTWLQTAADAQSIAFTLTETSFNVGDVCILAVEGAWDDPINLQVELEVYESFQEADS